MPRSPARIPFLAALCHHRWALPVLCALARRRGARAAELYRALGMNRETLKITLRALADLALVEGNPGHGHPLRPEWLLTPAGKALAPRLEALLAAAADLGVEALIGRKWILPLLAALAAGERRYSELAGLLPDISPRALAQALREGEQEGLIARRVTADHPPAVAYGLSAAGRRLARHLPD